MIKNYIKIAIRNLFRYRGYSAINILGLAVGVASCILILLFVQNEMNYDKFHENGDRIYRILRTAKEDNGLRRIAVTSAPFADALLTDYPADIEATTRVMPNDALVSYGDKVFHEKKFYLADANFFSFFSYPLVSGRPAQVLKEPNSVVISQDIARKYFGEKDPVGKVFNIDKQYDFKITGIFGKTPGNSHLDFDFVASLDIFKNRPWFKDWWSNSFFTYVTLNPGASPKNLKATFPAFMDKYFGEHFRTSGLRMGLMLEPLKDIYFDNNTTFDLIRHGARTLVYIFSAIALLILLIGCINFMNLATARSTKRAMEVGLRKVMGAHRRNLVVQFVGEAVILAAIAMILALMLEELLLPYCNHLFQLNLSLHYSDWRLTLLLITAALVIGLLAGSYPAFVLSRFQPAKVLKSTSGKSSGLLLRRILVVAQFSVSIILIICTIIMFRQINYLTSRKMGFDKDQVVLVPLNNRESFRNRENLKRELLRHSEIVAVSAMSGAPGGFHDNYSFDIQGVTNGARRLRTVYTDFDYCKTLRLKIAEGHDFSNELATDSTGILLNEKAVKSLGWTKREAIGKLMMISLLDSTRRHVIGVVKDYNFTSLKNEIEPLAISIYPDYRVMAIRLKSGVVPKGLQVLKMAWKQAVPGYPLEYTFLDESFDMLYKAEQNQREIFTLFSLVAVFIACLGLFGLATYAAESRTKEIGIRKVLGASISGIVALMSKEFLQLVFVAFIIAIPVAYLGMSRWLQDFAYRINISPWVFLLVGGMAILIALLSVGYQAIKAALANPVESLRYE
jgi:putative ABC transport system permease protein